MAQDIVSLIPPRGSNKDTHGILYFSSCLLKALIGSVNPINKWKIEEVQVGRGMPISHLLFIHDVLLFKKGYIKEAEYLKEDIDIYIIAIGM